MAVAVARSQLTPQQIQFLSTSLCFQPIVGYNKFNRRAEPPAPINFYLFENDVFYIPYLFAASLLQITPNTNKAYHPIPIAFKGTMLERQVSVYHEAYQQLMSYGTTTLGLYPGFGKTIMGAIFSALLGKLTVVLVHREILTTQWKKTFTDNTNARVWIVGEPDPPPIYDVIICMDQRWVHIPVAVRMMVGTLIIDEAHSFCTPSHVRCLLAFQPLYIIAESATLERDDGMHAMIYSICGSHGVFRESKKAFRVQQILTNVTPPRKQTRFGTLDWAALVNATLMDPYRNQLIMSFVQANINCKILILTSLVDHTNLIYNNLQRLGISSDYLCGGKRGYVDSTVLVGTVSKIGTGFDPATSCPTYAGRPFDLLILVCSLKKYSMLEQNVGRVFRAEFPAVIHFVDNDPSFKSHWDKARRWYNVRGGTIETYNIPNPTATIVASDPHATVAAWLASKK